MNFTCLSYQLLRLDRNRHGGGILIYIYIYVHNMFSYKLLIEGGPFNLEFLSISVTSPFLNSVLCICLFYRPPSSSVCIFDHLLYTLQLLNPFYFSTFLLMGDFNVNFYNSSNFLLSHIFTIMQLFSLTQVVSSYTHVCPTGNTSLIDLALISNTSKVSQCQTISPLCNSDHLGVEPDIKVKNISMCQKSGTRTVWLNDHADFRKANNLISATDWKGLLCDNVDDSVQRWQENFLKLCGIAFQQNHYQNVVILRGYQDPSSDSYGKGMHNFRKQSNFTPCEISLFKKQNFK